jgi:hypothetical protein
MAFSEQFVDDNETFVAGDFPYVQGTLEEVSKDLLGALFCPRCNNDV